MHGLLNWRLGLDFAELALGVPLNEQRWMNRSQNVAAQFVNTFGHQGDLVVENLQTGLLAIGRSDLKKAVLLGHPLWRQDPAFFNDRQSDSYDELLALGYEDPKCSDLYLAGFKPYKMWSILQ